MLNSIYFKFTYLLLNIFHLLKLRNLFKSVFLIPTFKPEEFIEVLFDFMFSYNVASIMLLFELLFSPDVDL